MSHPSTPMALLGSSFPQAPPLFSLAPSLLQSSSTQVPPWALVIVAPPQFPGSSALLGLSGSAAPPGSPLSTTPSPSLIPVVSSRSTPPWLLAPLTPPWTSVWLRSGSTPPCYIFHHLHEGCYLHLLLLGLFCPFSPALRLLHSQSFHLLLSPSLPHLLVHLPNHFFLSRTL